MTVNAGYVTDIKTIDFPPKDVLNISEQLRNIRAEHDSKCLDSKSCKLCKLCNTSLTKR